MNNLFGIGILLELRDRVSDNLRGVTRALDETETQAERTTRTFNDMDAQLSSSNSRRLTREMELLSGVLGGEVSDSTRNAYAEMYLLRQEMDSTRRSHGRFSEQTRQAQDNMHNFAMGLDDATFKQIFMRNQLGLSEVQLRRQAQSIQLTARMTRLMGNQTQILTQRMQGLQRNGVKPEHMLPPSTLGQFQMMNEVMHLGLSPLNRLSSGYRNLGTKVEGVIKKFSAQKIAVKMAQGDMVRYGLILRSLQAGMMNFNMAFMAVGVGALAFYGGLFKIAYESNERLQELASTVKNKLSKAFEPLIKVAGQFLEKILNLVGAVADWMIKLNQAHPVLGKILAIIGFLAPAMTLLLLPLGLGIGLWKGWMLVLNSVWTLIGGVVTMIGTASATFLTFASIIGAVVWSFIYLMQTNEEFNKRMTNIWTNLKGVIGDACGVMKKHWDVLKISLGKVAVALWESVSEIFSIGAEIVMSVLDIFFSDVANGWNGTWESFLPILDSTLGSITDFLVEKLNALAIHIRTFTSNVKEWWKVHGEETIAIVVGFYNNLKTGIQIALEALASIISPMLDQMKQFWDKHGSEVVSIVTRIASMLGKAFNGIAKACFKAFKGIGEFMEEHGDTITKIIDVAWFLISSIITGILDNIQGIIEGTMTFIGGIIKFFSALFKGDFEGMWEGIKDIFFGAIEAIYNGVMLYFTVGFIGSIKTMGVKALAGVKGMWTGIKEGFGMGVINCKIWVDDLVKAIIKYFRDLPGKLVTLADKIWTKITQAFVKGVGWVVKVVKGFIRGVIQFFADLRSGSTNIFSLLWSKVVTLWNTGVEFCKGIIQGMKDKVMEVISTMISNVIRFFLDLVAGAKQHFSNFISTVVEFVSQLPTKIKTFTEEALNYLKGISLLEIGKRIIQGLISGITEKGTEVKTKFSTMMDEVKTKLDGFSLIDSAKTILATFIKGVSDKYEEVKTKFNTMMSDVESKLNEFSLSDCAKTILNTFIKGVSDKYEEVKTKFSTMMEDVKTKLSSISLVEIAKGIISSFISGITGKTEEVKSGITKPLDEAKTKLKGFSLLDCAKTIIGTFITGITGKGEEIKTKFSEMVEGIKTKLSGFSLIECAKNILSTFIQGIGEKSLEVNPKFSSIIDGIKAFFGGTSFFSNAVTLISTFISGVLSKGTEVKPKFTNIIAGVKSFLSAVSIMGNAITILGTFISGVASKSGAVRNTFSLIITNVKSFLNSVSLNSIGSKILTSLASGVASVGSTVKAKFVTIIGNVKSYLGGVSLYSIGSSIVKGLANGIKGGASAVTNAIKGAVQGAIDKGKSMLKINSPSKVFRSMGYSINEGMVQGVVKTTPQVINSVGNMARGTIDHAKDVLKSKIEVVTTPLKMLGIMPNGGNTENINSDNSVVHQSTISNLEDVTNNTFNTNTSNLKNITKDMSTSTKTKVEKTQVNNEYNYTINVETKGAEDPRSLAKEIYQEIKKLQQLDISMNYNNDILPTY